MAAAAAGIIGGNGCSSSSSSSWFKLRDRQRKKKMANRVMFCSASSVIDPYKTLKIQPGASESDVKKAFRQLALQVFFFFILGFLGLVWIFFFFLSRLGLYLYK